MQCRKQKYKEFCSRFTGIFPYCENAGTNVKSFYDQDWRRDLEEPTLLLQFWGQQKDLLRNETIKLKSLGHCMYPVLKSSDILYVAIKDIKDIQVGDIPVYRAGNRLFGHRIVAKKILEGKECVLTRADGAVGDDAQTVFAEDILGVVVQIERGGKFFSPSENKRWNILEKAMLRWFGCRDRLWGRLIELISCLQGYRLYRKFMAPLILWQSSNINFLIRIPLNAHGGECLYREVSKDTFAEEIVFDGGNVGALFKLSLRINDRVIATVLFSHRPDDCPFSGWWMSCFQMWTRYRGLGIEERLFQESCDLLRRVGAEQVFTGVPRSDFRNKEILCNLGFEETVLPFGKEVSDLAIWQKQII